MTGRQTNVLSVFLNREHYPAIVKADGIYMFDEAGKRYIDAASGPVCCNLGHGVKEMSAALQAQMDKVAFVYRMDFTTPVLEQAATKVCQATGGAMDRVFFVSGGSEANEIAIKLARKYHLDNGEPSRFRVVSRWLSYHGMTAGALSWSGMTSRRHDYIPLLQDTPHIAPAYCYRCWFGRQPETCQLECAEALETEILIQGPETIAAFMAEPLSGMSLCAAKPRQDYFQRIRQICDQYGVLLILDEVMTGFGRTGKWFAMEHFGIVPDILVMGKGLGGGYFPVGAVAASKRVAETIAGKSGLFAAGFTWAGNPMAAAVVCRAIDYLREHKLVDRVAEMGEYLTTRLETLRDHPTLGDIRGQGLMRGLEFVNNKTTKEPLPQSQMFAWQLSHEALERGMYIEWSWGCDRGQNGDMVMLAPPFVVNREQIDEIVALFDQTLTAVEKRIGK